MQWMNQLMKTENKWDRMMKTTRRNNVNNT